MYNNTQPMQPGMMGLQPGMAMQPGYNNTQPMQPGMMGLQPGMAMQPGMVRVWRARLAHAFQPTSTNQPLRAPAISPALSQPGVGMGMQFQMGMQAGMGIQRQSVR